MSFLDALAQWATGLVSAALVAALGLGSLGAPVDSPTGAGDGGILSWAQGVDEATIQQVGEEAQADDADAEALDAGSPSQASATSTDGEVAVDQTVDDVELLDQGTPDQVTTSTEPGVETTAAETTAPVTVVDNTAPVATGDVAVTETVVDTGPHLPEGFGEGQVLVSTGSGAFPPGLDECHVGAVTGRAYVGIDCDEEGGSFVGHAPSFDEFPFVTDEDFPFDNDDPIVADENFPFGGDESNPTIELNSESDASSNVYVAAGGRTEGPFVSLPEGSEGAVIERAQRVRGEATTDQSVKKSNRNRSTSISVDASSGNSSDRVQSASKDSRQDSRDKSSANNESKNGKAKHKQKAKSNKGNNKNKGKDKSKKASKNSKSDDSGKKSKNGKKENRKKNR